MRPYGREFARAYDLLIHGRDEAEAHPHEVAFVRRVFAETARRPVRDVLDVGCGRGRFLVPLARAGYRLSGVDISRDMLEECGRRLEREGLEAELAGTSMEALEYEQQFDALLCLDSVICYLLETERLLETLCRFHRALRPGGVAVLDNWNMLAQWALLDRPRQEQIQGEHIRVEYREHDSYESLTSLFRMRIEGEVHEGGETRSLRHEEVLRVTTVEEMKMALGLAGFAEVTVHPDYGYGAREPLNPESLSFVALRPGSLPETAG